MGPNHYNLSGQGIRETAKGAKRQLWTDRVTPPPGRGGWGWQVGQPDTSRGGISVHGPTTLLPLVNSAKTPRFDFEQAQIAKVL